MPEDLRLGDFSPHLNTTFRALYAPEQSLELVLIEATDPDAHKEVKPRRQERFTLLFRGGEKGALLRDGIYKFRHERMGEFDLYISPVHIPPVEPDEAGVYYEAVFNRLIRR
jgi:hypothetical protein